MDKSSNKFEITSAGLHILAMTLMLSDHLWGSLLGQYRILTMIGRVAYPIFAFMIVEGYYHTSDLKKYMKRLLIFALISEFPFNLFMGGKWFGPIFLAPFHQNVLWTFLLGLLMILLFEKIKKLIHKITGFVKNESLSLILYWILYVIFALLICYLSKVVGNITFVDFFGGGVMTVFVFYLFYERKWWNLLLQVVFIYYINVELISGMLFPVSIFGKEIFIAEQGLALLALIPIWLYKGNQGYHSKWFKYLCYAFYPAHMLVLALLYRLL